MLIKVNKTYLWLRHNDASRQTDAVAAVSLPADTVHLQLISIHLQQLSSMFDPVHC